MANKGKRKPNLSINATVGCMTFCFAQEIGFDFVFLPLWEVVVEV